MQIHAETLGLRGAFQINNRQVLPTPIIAHIKANGEYHSGQQSIRKGTRMAHSRTCNTDTAVGLFLNVSMPITCREWWSMTTATHQQNGQHWGNANGNHGAQKPTDVGTVVRSRCQT